MQNLRQELGRPVHLHQFDRTCDYTGYLYCTNVKEFADEFKTIGLVRANNKKYNTFSTCIHLVS